MPGVHDPGVVAGLVRGDGGFLLEHHDGDARRRELPRDREPDDARADDPDRCPEPRAPAVSACMSAVMPPVGPPGAGYHWYRTAVVLILV